ncbi:protein kinase domain-containing protein [Oleiharenicola sp. Vm1]|uniref:serine/threonine-protein kinase n=1 Tax=Oleiharenicola sp. Vm1 TaxID=3398393 RepID=UPI0039F4D095
MNRPDDEIFADALELPQPERAAFLDRACAGDAAQRARVEALLASAEAATRDFLEVPPVTRPESPEEKVGDRIGAYLLRRRIGEGGCGVVYLAEQTEPIRRQVALKVIKLGMDTREVIARFEAERQTLALMDHPCIARVYDAGATDTGRPFFVMEFVDGLPITRFCDEHRLTTEQRLDLFARVCLAIQHAHQKGIIHRDVKPSNILVAMHDDTPMPKVIDFGIAKATQGRLAQRTLLTQVDQLVGTPAYMSPEQVESRDLDIDTRSDVYSLGVLLYELLAGRPPYDPQSLVQAGLAEIRRIIREVDPPRPSTRLATLAAADRDTVARLRNAAPVQLTSVLRGDLDWIVMRCLEKDRARRYGTASELADDIRRHLRHETVAARPPDALYRARKFISRHRLACASVAAIAASLVAGTVVSLVQANRARRAEALARLERDVARAAQQAEGVARADAQRRQDQAEALLTFMLGDFRSELKKIGKLGLLDAVGDKAMAHFAALDPKDLTDPALTQQAKALTQIGEIRLDQARYVDAAKAFETAYQRSAALVTRHPQNADMLFERAQAEFWIGFTARRRGDVTAAREWLTRYRDSTTALEQLEGSTTRALRESSSGAHNLAVLEFEQGNLAMAKIGFEAVRKAREQLALAHPNDLSIQAQLADNSSWLGRVAESDGRYADALGHYGEMNRLLTQLIALEPNVPRWRSRFADGLVFSATVMAFTGDKERAAEKMAEAQSIYDALAKSDQQNQQWRILALSLALIRAEHEIGSGSTEPASRLLDSARKEIVELAAAEPTSQTFRRRLATAYRLDARLNLERAPNLALEAATRAASILQALLNTDPNDAWLVWEYAQSVLLAGRAEAKLQHHAEAEQRWRSLIGVLSPQVERRSNEWRLLDPLAQANALVGEEKSARSLVAELKRHGYRAVDPLSASTLEVP